MIGQTISHYKILSEIGEGGMGVVYLAEDITLKRRVAIKMLKTVNSLAQNQFKLRLLREARVVSKLNHPNIATVHDFGETDDGHPYIVMEYVDGDSLDGILSRKTLTLTRSIEIISQTAEALQEAHRHGLIHRDIKPSNIVLNYRGEVKVLDFGIAKQIEPETLEFNSEELPTKSLAIKTGEGIIVGTPLYFSPEQAAAKPLDARSDLFSLGAILYECLTNVSPFDAPSIAEICAKVLKENPLPPSSHNEEISSRLDKITMKALAKEPAQRYQNASEFLEDLHGSDETLEATALLTNQNVHSTKSFSQIIRTGFTEILQRPKLLLTGSIAALTLSLAFFFYSQFSKNQPYQPSPQGLHWYREGEKAFLDGLYFKAGKIFTEAIKTDENFAMARIRRADALLELGYFEEARDELNRVYDLLNGANQTLLPDENLYFAAVKSMQSRDFPKALENFQKIADNASKEGKTEAAMNLGRAYEKNEDLPKAVETYENLIKQEPSNAAAFVRLGNLCRKQGNYTGAETNFEKAKKLYELQSNPEGLAEVEFHQGAMLNEKNENDQAKLKLESALDLSKTNNLSYQQIKVFLQMGRALSLTESEKAKSYIEQAISLAQSEGIGNLQTQGFIELGNWQFQRNKIPEAENSYREALKLSGQYRLKPYEMQSLLRLGSLFIQQDKADEGLNFLNQALPFFKQGGYRTELSQVLALSGQAYLLKNDYRNSLDAYETLAKTAEPANDRYYLARAQKGIGAVFTAQEKFNLALEPIQKSYSLYNDLGRKFEAGYSLLELANNQWQMGNYEAAKAALAQAAGFADAYQQLWLRHDLISARLALSARDFKEAARKAQKVIDSDGSKEQVALIEAKSILGLIQTYSGSKTTGRKFCEEAVQKAEKTNDSGLKNTVNLNFAKSLIENQESPEALNYAQRILETIDPLDLKETKWKVWLIIGLANQRQNADQTAREALSNADQAFSVLEQLWGTEDFRRYQTRPDIKNNREILLKTSATLNP